MTLPPWSALTFLLIMTLPQVILSDLRACSIPSNFSLKISADREANILGAELWTIIKTEDVMYTTFPNRELGSIVANEAFAAFRGRIIIEDLEDGILSRPVRFSRMFDSRAAGTARLTRGVGGINYLQDCRLSLALDNDIRGMGAAVISEIRRLAEYCLGAHFCQIMNTASSPNNWRHTYQDRFLLKNANMIPDRESISVDPGTPLEGDQGEVDPETAAAGGEGDSFSPELAPEGGEISPGIAPASTPTHKIAHYKHEFSQLSVNNLVDTAIVGIVDDMKKINGGKIDIPNIDEDFTTGVGPVDIEVGHFEAIKGKFKDLTSLKRAEDAILITSEQKRTVISDVKLSISQMQYQSYKVKVGLFSVGGNLRADIGKVTLKVKFSFDYGPSTCTKTLDEFEVTHLGKIKINVTGLGRLKHMRNKISNWISNLWGNEIVGQIERELKESTEKQLHKFDCEKYRPSN